MESPNRIQAAAVPHHDSCRYGWRLVNNTMEAIKFTFNSVTCGPGGGERSPWREETRAAAGLDAATNDSKSKIAGNEPANNKSVQRTSEAHQDPSTSQAARKHQVCGSGTSTVSMQHTLQDNNTGSASSIHSIGSLVCRICQNAEHPERLVSPCLCKGSLTYVHIYCLEHWISTSGKTTCELCQFRYHTIQTLRHTCLQSLRMWYTNSTSRRALQESCQMFSLLTLVAFSIVGTILVGIQYYIAQEKNTHTGRTTRLWIKGWLVFCLCLTFAVYFTNVYMIARQQLVPWYMWWQSAREIKLILENRKTYHPGRRLRQSQNDDTNDNAPQPQTTPRGAVTVLLQDAYQNPPITGEGMVFLNPRPPVENGARRNALLPTPSGERLPAQMHHQSLAALLPPESHQDRPQEQVEHGKRNQVVAQRHV